MDDLQNPEALDLATVQARRRKAERELWQKQFAIIRALCERRPAAIKRRPSRIDYERVQRYLRAARLASRGQRPPSYRLEHPFAQRQRGPRIRVRD